MKKFKKTLKLREPSLFSKDLEDLLVYIRKDIDKNNKKL